MKVVARPAITADDRHVLKQEGRTVVITPRGYFPIVNAEKEKENTLPVAGPVNSYKLSEEELKKVHEKYGKPGQLAPEPKKPDIAQPEPATVQFKKKTLAEQKMEEVSREEFARMLETMSLNQIGEKLGVSVSTVVSIRDRYGLLQPEKKSGTKPIQAEPAKPVAAEPKPVPETREPELKETERKPKPSYYKHDTGKPRLSLVPPSIIEAIGIIRTYGTQKYNNDPDGWRQVEPDRYVDALMRHLARQGRIRRRRMGVLGN